MVDEADICALRSWNACFVRYGDWPTGRRVPKLRAENEDMFNCVAKGSERADISPYVSMGR